MMKKQAYMYMMIVLVQIMVLSIFVACSTSSKLQNRQVDGQIVFIEEKTAETNPLSKEILDIVDAKTVPLNQMILIVRYADEGEYDVEKDNRNSDAHYVESNLFVLLKEIKNDISQRTGLLLQSDEILNTADDTVHGAIIPEVFYWEGMSFVDDDKFELLFSSWNSGRNSHPLKSKQFVESLFDISISFINEKHFLGYEVHLTLKTYNRLRETSRDYTTTYIYHIK